MLRFVSVIPASIWESSPSPNFSVKGDLEGQVNVIIIKVTSNIAY